MKNLISSECDKNNCRIKNNSTKKKSNIHCSVKAGKIFYKKKIFLFFNNKESVVSNYFR